MRAITIILVLGILCNGCKQKEECKVCPENYVLKDNECICQGIMVQGECRNEKEFFEHHGYLGDDTKCSMNSFSDPEVLTIYFLSNEHTKSASIEFHTPDDIWRSTLHVHGSDSAFYIPSSDRGFSNSESWEHKFYTREIDGETQYLRAYLKKLHDKYFRVHFTWETRWGTERERCTRIFHQ